MRHNLRQVRRMIGEDCRLMFVLKADAYGHGTPVCARYSEDLVDWYAAATIDEALSIRRAGVEKPILLFGMLLDQDIPAAVDARLTVNACSLEYARHVAFILERMGETLDCHIKIDTGMNRTGLYARAGRVDRAAEEAGVDRGGLLIDCLALAASASRTPVLAAAEAIRLVRQAGYRTVLGVSNVSYGLPGRDALNCAYLAACLAAGLDVAIVNTGSSQIRQTLAASRVLLGEDPGCAAYIAEQQAAAPSEPAARSAEQSLEALILSGQKAEAPAAAEALLERLTPLEVVNGYVIPALDRVGELYEEGTLFLPQLMASAEAVKAAFAVLRRRMPQGTAERGTILLATVKNDVHDIGKNIVGMLLENYGYRVIDLGRDVAPETVVRAALETGAPLVGLSSLMTTTAQNIAETIRALRAADAPCKVMVGGAVVTQDFANQIGADFYVRDAAQSARAAAQVFGGSGIHSFS